MRTFVAVLIVLALSGVARADDWPQWMGPGRDNQWRETGVLERFPEGGLKVVWRAPVAGGYAGPAVAQGRVFVTDYVTADDVKIDNFQRKEFTGIERVLCLEEASGKLLWKHEYPVRYTVSYPAGPRCTPTVDGNKVYTLGTEGNLFCFDVETGRVNWSHDFPKEYNTKSALWGYASHPLIDGQQLICIVGGEGSHVVAFDKESGKELWRALTSKEQGYSPPTIIRAGGVRQLVLLRPDAVTAVDPANGKEYWSVPYQASNGSIIMSPLVSGDLLYAAGYSDKNLLLRLSSDKPAAEVVWRDLSRKAISPVNVQPFLQGDTLYGFDQSGWLYGMDLASGDRLWQSSAPFDTDRAPATGTAFIVKHGDKFWMFNELRRIRGIGSNEGD
jgi:outer membrane protein assembly factor BamB